MTKYIKGLLAATLIVGSAGAAVWAQNAAVEQPAKVTVPANVLSVGDIESRLTAQGIKVKEVEIRDLIAEVEGYDAQGREVELVIDRRTGDTLAHKYDR
ncbi:MAG: PepSY domain-containing protein [Steroidobacter sp.]